MRSRLASVLLLAAVACAQPPTAELELTKTRVEAARAEHAPVFAPELFAEAVSSLEESERRIEERDYRAALTALAHASLRADEAYARASAERFFMEKRFLQLRFELEGLLEMAGARAAEGADDAELARFQESYREVVALIERGDLPAAFEAATALKPELLALEARLQPQ